MTDDIEELENCEGGGAAVAELGPWAACIKDGERSFDGKTKEDAIWALLEDYGEELVSNGWELEPHAVEVVVYADAVFCSGPEDELEECEWGCDHNEHRWTLVGWGLKGSETWEIAFMGDPDDPEVVWTRRSA